MRFKLIELISANDNKLITTNLFYLLKKCYKVTYFWYKKNHIKYTNQQKATTLKFKIKNIMWLDKKNLL